MENHRILFLPNFLISLLVCILVRIARVIWLAIISKSKILDFRGSRQINFSVRTGVENHRVRFLLQISS